MGTYLIDFENVKSEGLSGISELAPNDNVLIFFSNNENKLSFDIHKQICSCSTNVLYFHVAAGGKNALDHQLAGYLGYLIGSTEEKEYYIVSRDRGFEFVINFWKEQRPELFIRMAYNLKVPGPDALKPKDLPIASSEEEKLSIAPTLSSKSELSANSHNTETANQIASSQNEKSFKNNPKPDKINKPRQHQKDDKNKSPEKAETALSKNSSRKTQEQNSDSVSNTVVEAVVEVVAEMLAKQEANKTAEVKDSDFENLEQMTLDTFPKTALLTSAETHAEQLPFDKFSSSEALSENKSPESEASSAESLSVSKKSVSEEPSETASLSPKRGRYKKAKPKEEASSLSLSEASQPLKQKSITEAEVKDALPDFKDEPWILDITKYINNAQSRAWLYNSVRKKLGQDKGSVVYKAIKRFWQKTSAKPPQTL